MCAPGGVQPCGGMLEGLSSGPGAAVSALGSLSPSTNAVPLAESSSVAASTAASESTTSSKSPDTTPSSSSPASVSLPVFSPSRTERFLLCPMRESYERTWRPLAQREAPWAPHLVLGNAIHAGLAHYHSQMSGSYLGEASNILEREFEEGGAWTLTGLMKLVEKGIRASLDSPLLGPNDTVVATEDTIGEHRADLVFRTPGVGLHVWDYKTKLELKTDWVPRELAQYEESWQLKQTAWAVSQKYGEPVVETGVQLIVLSPRCKAYPVSQRLDAEIMANWLRSAERVWVLMAMKQPFMNTWACRKFGPCPYIPACFVMAGDEAKFPALYERIGQ